MSRLGLIGAGGMAETLLATLARRAPGRLDALRILATSAGLPAAQSLAQRYGERVARTGAACVDLPEFLADGLDLVVECAGHAAVAQHGPVVLAQGCDLLVVSVGALADDALRGALEAAAARGGAELILPAGAIGGLDALGAARLSGLAEVVYTGRKPPDAWRGTAAERTLDLDGVREPATFFRGSAREAARMFPQNANVAAAVALAGAGFDDTRVELIADPRVTQNIHEISVRSAATDFTIRLAGRPSPGNPKTSLTAGFSVAHCVLKRLFSGALEPSLDTPRPSRLSAGQPA